MHHHHHGNNNLLSSRTAVSPERHLLLQGGNIQGDSGLVLSTDAKPRLKWTPELHECFIGAVNQLGGPDKATPKTVARLMGIPGLTLYHLKSHLQKYRLSKNLQVQSGSGTTKDVVGYMISADKISEVDDSLNANTNAEVETSKNLQINESLQMQIEVQRQLNEQLEGLQGLTSVMHETQQSDCTMESCLTSCEESQENLAIHDTSRRLISYPGSSFHCAEQTRKDKKLEYAELSSNGYSMHSSSIFPVQRDTSFLSVNFRNERLRDASAMDLEEIQNDIDGNYSYLEEPSSKRFAVQHDKVKAVTC